MRLKGLELDGQAMTVPARYIFDLMALLQFDSQDDVLEDLVQCVADMKGTVSIRRSIVEEEGLGIWSIVELPLVERGGAALQIMVAELLCRSRSGGLWFS